ncbi:hypothetical protein LPJ56_005590 [Coemansia sp. RSA 2599]|nr:hypothetical protein LPJ75_005570 [Coemansia sp. RSA 2598]KAJ1812141.1 hypothetical protein LPJ56_005590 [Coemansia sp. RSA 2599]
MFHMPTEEEQKARVAKWEKELVGKQLEDDLTEQQSDALGDGPSSHAGGSGEAEDRKEDDAKESKDDVKESKGDEGETADSKVVKLSTLPQPVRVIRPGSRVTRDLRPNRMNVVCDESGLILKDSNHSHVSSISQDMTLEEVKDKLGEPSEVSGSVYKWKCPGDASKCISVTFANNKATDITRA